MIEHLTSFITDLERERELIDERIRLANELLASLDDDTTLAAEPAKPPKADKPKKRTPANKGRAYERIPCPDCGEMIAKTQMNRHRTSKHPDSAAKPVEQPARPAQITTKVFRCGDDDQEFPTIADLTHHTLVEHSRQPAQGERIPVTPDAARTAA